MSIEDLQTKPSEQCSEPSPNCWICSHYSNYISVTYANYCDKHLIMIYNENYSHVNSRGFKIAEVKQKLDGGCEASISVSKSVFASLYTEMVRRKLL